MGPARTVETWVPNECKEWQLTRGPCRLGLCETASGDWERSVCKHALLTASTGVQHSMRVVNCEVAS